MGIVILCSLAVLALLQIPVSNASGYCSTLFGYNAHPEDCTKFFRCVWGSPVEFTCPAGTRWSQYILTCDHAYNVPCYSGVSSSEYNQYGYGNDYINGYAYDNGYDNGNSYGNSVNSYTGYGTVGYNKGNYGGYETVGQLTGGSYVKANEYGNYGNYGKSIEYSGYARYPSYGSYNDGGYAGNTAGYTSVAEGSHGSDGGYGQVVSPSVGYGYSK